MTIIIFIAPYKPDAPVNCILSTRQLKKIIVRSIVERGNIIRGFV
jgi:hypothetical protein